MSDEDMYKDWTKEDYTLEKAEEEWLNEIVREEEEIVNKEYVLNNGISDDEIEEYITKYTKDSFEERDYYLKMQNGENVDYAWEHEKVIDEMKKNGFLISFMGMGVSFYTNITMMQLLTTMTALRTNISLNKKSLAEIKNNTVSIDDIYDVIDRNTIIGIIDSIRILEHLYDMYKGVLDDASSKFIDKIKSDLNE